MNCQRCDQPLQMAGYENVTDEPQNEVYVTLTGGYGSFIDSFPPVGGKPYEYVLCEGCASFLCREFKFLDALREHHGSTICSGRKGEICTDRTVTDDSWEACRCEVCS